MQDGFSSACKDTELSSLNRVKLVDKTAFHRKKIDGEVKRRFHRVIK
jgi:hypothetical protein